MSVENADIDFEHSISGSETQTKEFLTIIIADQRFGIPILQVQDVLGEQAITKVPLAPAEVEGSLNLRGRIVTAINVRRRLGIEADNRSADEQHTQMSVVVEHENELYSLLIDEVGDVLKLKDDTFEPTLATLDSLWKEVSLGIYRLEGELLIILDVPKFLSSVNSSKEKV